MKILLILSHLGTKHGLFNEYVYTSFYPSLTLEQLISITPEKYEVDCVDERWENIDFDWDGSLVGISTQTPSAQYAYRVADEFRRRGKTVVLGGYHPSALPEEAKRHADAVVIGEAELSWPQLLRDFEKGKMKPFYKTISVDPKKIPSPKRIPKYFRNIEMIQASRGCPYGCKYCAGRNVEGSFFRPRPIENVIEEIKSIRSNYLFFADSSLTINPEYSKKLFNKMKGLNKKFSCYGNINVLSRDNELLALASEAGCEQWHIGFESISQKTLRNMGKNTNKVEGYASGVKKIKDYGMMILGLFMFGFDTDKPDVFKTTLNTINSWDLDRAAFAILTPFPGTELFNELEREGRILTKDWSKYNLRNVVFKPKNFSVEQLLNGRNSLAKEYYSFSNVFRRSFQDKNLNFNRLIKKTAGDYLLNRFFKTFVG